MDELHTGRHAHMAHIVAMFPISGHTGRCEHQQGPEPLTACRHQMGCQLRDQRHVALHPRHDFPVAGHHVIGEIVSQSFQDVFTVLRFHGIIHTCAVASLLFDLTCIRACGALRIRQIDCNVQMTFSRKRDPSSATI